MGSKQIKIQKSFANVINFFAKHRKNLCYVLCRAVLMFLIQPGSLIMHKMLKLMMFEAQGTNVCITEGTESSS